jgi:hypothetical protein
MKTSLIRALFLIGVSILFTSASHAAPLLAVDFGNSSSFTQSGFQEWVQTGSTVPTAAPYTRTFGSYTVNVAAGNNATPLAFNSSGDLTQTLLLIGRDRAVPATDDGTFSNSLLYRDFVGPQTAVSSPALAVQITGLSAFTGYSVSLYSYDNTSSKTVSFTNITGANDVSANGANVALGSISWTAGATFGSSTANDVYSLTSIITSDAFGRITIRGVAGSTVSPVLSGLTITAIPEPSTYAVVLAGASLALVLGARRRK